MVFHNAGDVKYLHHQHDPLPYWGNIMFFTLKNPNDVIKKVVRRTFNIEIQKVTNFCCDLKKKSFFFFFIQKLGDALTFNVIFNQYFHFFLFFIGGEKKKKKILLQERNFILFFFFFSLLYWFPIQFHGKEK